jgi:hypothetical protein
MGDSHFAFDIKNSILNTLDSSMISYSLPGNNIYNTLIYLDRLKENNTLPKILVIDSDIHNLAIYRDGANSLVGTLPYFLSVNTLKIWGVKKTTKVLGEAYLPFLSTNGPSAVQNYCNQLLNNGKVEMNSFNTTNLDYLQGNAQLDSTDRQTAHKRAKLLYGTISANLISEYQKLILFCRDNNVTLMGLRMPLSPYVRENKLSASINDHLPADMKMEEISLEDYFGKNNYMFSDIDHLTEDWGRKFTPVVRQVIALKYDSIMNVNKSLTNE